MLFHSKFYKFIHWINEYPIDSSWGYVYGEVFNPNSDHKSNLIESDDNDNDYVIKAESDSDEDLVEN